MAERAIRPRCPQCGNRGEMTLWEFWRDSGIAWDQDADGRTEVCGGIFEGSPYRVEAKCRLCGKCWKLRGVTQISQLATNQEANERENA